MLTAPLVSLAFPRRNERFGTAPYNSTLGALRELDAKRARSLSKPGNRCGEAKNTRHGTDALQTDTAW